MPKIPKYYVRPDGLHESIIMVPTADGGKKRKAFRGKTDLEVWNKIKSYDSAKEPHPTGVRFEQVAERWWEQAEPTLTYNTARGYSAAYNRAKDHFCGELVSEITTHDINDFILDFARTRAKRPSSHSCRLSVRYSIGHRRRALLCTTRHQSARYPSTCRKSNGSCHPRMRYH